MPPPTTRKKEIPSTAASTIRSLCGVHPVASLRMATRPPRPTMAYLPSLKRTASCHGLLSSGVEMEVDAGDPPPRHPNHPRRKSRPDRARRRLHPVCPRPEPDGVAAAARRLHRGDHPAGTGEAEQDSARRLLAGIGPTDGRRSEHQPAKAGAPHSSTRTAEREHRRRECDSTDDCQAHDPLVYRRSG
jgi:hypothetical protein